MTTSLIHCLSSPFSKFLDPPLPLPHPSFHFRLLFFPSSVIYLLPPPVPTFSRDPFCPFPSSTHFPSIQLWSVDDHCAGLCLVLVQLSHGVVSDPIPSNVSIFSLPFSPSRDQCPVPMHCSQQRLDKHWTGMGRHLKPIGY